MNIREIVEVSKHIVEFAEDFVYPPRCNICNRMFKINSKERYICNSCVENMQKYIITSNKCDICTRITPKSRCSSCVQAVENGEVYKNYSPFLYDESSKKLIYSLKYGGDKEIAKVYGIVLEKWIKELNLEVDIIAPVPLYKDKEKDRGFNQSDLLAVEVAKILGVKYEKDLLIRVRFTHKQSGLTRKARRKNLKGAFVVNEKIDVVNKRVLLIDDIYTSGATIIECSNTLKKKGASNVESICITITGETLE